MVNLTRRQSLGMLAAVSIPPTATVGVTAVAPAAMALPAAPSLRTQPWWKPTSDSSVRVQS